MGIAVHNDILTQLQLYTIIVCGAQNIPTAWGMLFQERRILLIHNLKIT